MSMIKFAKRLAELEADIGLLKEELQGVTAELGEQRKIIDAMIAEIKSMKSSDGKRTSRTKAA